MPRSNHAQSPASRRLTLLTAAQGAITTALTKQQLGAILTGLEDVKYVAAQASFTYGSGGTSVNAYLQTSLDGGVTWNDIMNFSFTTATAVKQSAVVYTTALGAGLTPTNGTLTANTILSGLLGDQFQVIMTSVGTYVGSALAIDLVVKG